MQRLPDLEAFAAEHGLVLVTIADLIRYRRHREKLVRRVSQARIPTQYGDFTAHVFESLLDGVEHLAFVRGEVAGHDERARARALRVPHRRRVRIDALRLRHPARPRDGAGRRRRSRRGRVPPRPRGPRHRARPQAARVHAAGRRPRHRRGQPRARLPGRLARVRHRRADPRRPRRHHDAPDDEQPREVRRHRGLRPRDRRAGAGADRADRRRTSRTCAPSSASSGTSSASIPTPTPKTTRELGGG